MMAFEIYVEDFHSEGLNCSSDLGSRVQSMLSVHLAYLRKRFTTLKMHSLIKLK